MTKIYVALSVMKHWYDMSLFMAVSTLMHSKIMQKFFYVLSSGWVWKKVIYGETRTYISVLTLESVTEDIW